MDFFGIGWLELFFILIIILMVAGPKDIERGAKGLGRFINRLNRSASYQAIRRASTELRNLPQRLAREASLEELKELTQEVEQVKQEVQQVKQDLKETTNAIPNTPHKAFQAWVQEIPKAPAAPEASPTNGVQAPLATTESKAPPAEATPPPNPETSNTP